MKVGSSFDPLSCLVSTMDSWRLSSRHLTNLFEQLDIRFADLKCFECTSKSRPFVDFYLFEQETNELSVSISDQSIFYENYQNHKISNKKKLTRFWNRSQCWKCTESRSLEFILFFVFLFNCVCLNFCGASNSKWLNKEIQFWKLCNS